MNEAPADAGAFSFPDQSTIAKDVSQETFLRAFSRIDQLKEAGSFRPWLIGIARNLCFDCIRQRRTGEGDKILNDPVTNVPEDYRDVHRAIGRLWDWCC